MTITLTFYEKLTELQRQCKGIQKTGRNKFSNYDYATDEDITNAVMPLANSLGLFITFSASEGCTRYEDCGGTYYSLSSVNVTCTVYDNAGVSLSSSAHGFSNDKNGDKAAFKALTGGKKYALRFLLGLVTTDDPEQDSGGQSTQTTTKMPSRSSSKELPF